MKRTKRRILVLNAEQIRTIRAASDGTTAADTLDLTSQLSHKSGCQQTRFCCKPP